MRANGFEGGWAGDYSVVPQGTNAAVPRQSAAAHRRLRARGRGPNAARYVITTLPDPDQRRSPTASTRASPEHHRSGRPRRIRHWFGLSAQQPVVELYILPDARLQLMVGGDTLIGTTRRRSRACPTYTHFEVQYRAQGCRRHARAPAQRRARSSGTHNDREPRPHRPASAPTTPPAIRRASAGTITPSRPTPRGPAISASSRSTRRPTASGTRGRCRTASDRTVHRASDSVRRSPPPASAHRSPARASLLLPAGRGGAGHQRADPGREDHLIGARDEDPIGTLGGIFIRTGGCGNPSGVDQEEFTFDPRPSFTGFGRVRRDQSGDGPVVVAERHRQHRVRRAPREQRARAPSSRRSSWRWSSIATRRRRCRPPTNTVTATRTFTPTPTRTFTPSPTPTITDTPLGPTPTSTATRTATATSPRPRATPTARDGDRTRHADRHGDGDADTATPTETPLPSATFTPSATEHGHARHRRSRPPSTDTPARPSATPSETPTVTPTASTTTDAQPRPPRRRRPVRRRRRPTPSRRAATTSW